MNKVNGFLILIIFFLIFIISILAGNMYQQKQNEILMFERLETKISNLQEENRKQDVLIDEIIQNQALNGYFDKR